MVESGFWSACLSSAVTILETRGQGLQTSLLVYLQKEFNKIAFPCTFVSWYLTLTMFYHTFNICTRWNFWWILNIDI